MPPARVRTDYPTLAQIAQTFAMQATQLHHTQQGLQKQVAVLRGGDWMGQGATQFYSEMDSAVFPAWQRLTQALQQAAQTTRTMSQVLQQAEAAAARVFQLTDDTGPMVNAPAAWTPNDGGVGKDQQAAPRRTVEVENLRVRSAPGTSGTVVNGLPQGTTVTVLPDKPIEQNGYRWYHIQYTDPTIVNTATAASPDFRPPLTAVLPGGYAFGDSIDYYSGLPGDWAHRHTGMDYAPPGGDNQIVASATGTVVDSGFDPAYGNYAIVEYPASSVPASIRNLPGYEAGDSIYMIYAHMADAAPAIGTALNPGSPIGTVGTTGNSDGVHLHVELRFGEPGLPVTPRGDSDGAKNWGNAETLPPIDPGLIFTPTDTFTGWVAGESLDGKQVLLGPPA